MANKNLNHRVVISVRPATYAAIERLAKIEGRRPSEEIMYLLDQFKEPISLSAAAIEQAKLGHKGKALEMMIKLSGQSLRQMGEAMGGKKKSGPR